MRRGILFLTLRVFSATGGIEKVCRVVCKALMDMSENSSPAELKVFSMYDGKKDIDEKYIDPDFFSGFGEKKISFVSSAVSRGCRSYIVILSHINLISVGFLIKLLSPKTKIVLFAHGIEVWGPLSAARKRMLKNCDCIMAVSEFTKKNNMNEQQLNAEKITVLNNCIDPYLPDSDTGKNEGLQKRYGFTNENIVLMTLARLSSKELYKGYDHVLYSVNYLKDKYPGIRYLIVGRYDEAEKQRLDNIIKQHSLEAYVVFTGYIPDNELANHYCLADIYVMPSKKEGFGIVFIEAMHYGLPVIAGNKDGSADALCNGRLGLLVNPDDQDEINIAIEKTIVNRECFKSDHVLLMESFSYENYKKKFSQILNSL